MPMAIYKDVIRAMADAISAREQKYYADRQQSTKYYEWAPMGDYDYGRARYLTTGSNVYTTPELYGRDASQWIIDEYHTESFNDWWRREVLNEIIHPSKKAHTRKDISIEEFDRLLMGDENGNV